LGAERGRYPFDACSWWHPPNKTAAQGWHQGGGANDLHTAIAVTSTFFGRRWQQRGLGDADRLQAGANLATILGTFNAEHQAGLVGGGS
jgi:hypothetical protein